MSDAIAHRLPMRPLVALVTGRALGFAAAFAIPVILARRLDPAGFGSYKRIFLLYGTLYGIAQCGFAESLYYFLPRFPARAGSLVANALAALALAGAAAGLAITFARGAVARALGDAKLAPLLPLAALFLGLMLVSSLLEITQVALQRARLASLTYLASDLARAALLVVPVLLIGTLEALLAGAVLFSFLRAAGAISWLRHQGGLRLDWTLLRAQCGYALPFALAVLIESAASSLHQYVVSFRFDGPSFALYSVALLQIPLVDYVATTASSVAMVRMGALLEQHELAAARQVWHDTIGKLALLFIPLVALVAVEARDVIELLFTERYAASVPLFRLATLVLLLAPLQTDTVLRVFAHTRGLLVLNLMRLAAVAAVIDPAITRWRLAGAIGASLFSSLVFRGASLVLIRRLLGVSLRALLPLRRLALTLAVSAVAALAAWGLRFALHGPRIANLLATSCVFGAVFLMAAVQTRLLPSLDWSELRARFSPAPGAAEN